MPDIPFFDLGRLVTGRREVLLERITSVVDSGWFIGGPVVEEFETAFADYLGVKHCVGLGNGLDALRIGLEAAGVGPGDEVLVPGFTFYATWLAVLQTGATPVPVDVDPATASLEGASLEAHLTNRTRAVLPVHLFGIPSDVRGIAAFARENGLIVLEDVAQAHGMRVDGVAAGAWGTMGAFSFYPTKNLGALGDAGALVTDDDDLAARARSRRSYGQGKDKYDHIDTGWNSRLDPMQAAVLLSGLSELDGWNARRRAIAGAYRDALDPAVATVGPRDVDGSVWHHFVVRSARRSEFRAYLSSAGIGSDVHYPYSFDSLEPTRRTIGSRIVDLPHSRALAESVVSLPIGPWLSDAEVERVAAALQAAPPELLLSRE